MINLLSPAEKNKIRMEKKKRMIIILWFLFLYFLLSLFLTFSIVRIYLFSKVEPEKIMLSEKEKTLEGEELKEIQEEIKEANKTLNKIKSFYKEKTYYAEILENLANKVPGEIYITNFSFNVIKEKEGKTINFSLSGYSPDLESLLLFRNNLKDWGFFKEVIFAPSSWINPENFSISLKL